MPLSLILAERLGVLLSLPRLDLPAGLSVVGVDAGHPAEGELLPDHVGTLALVEHLGFEAAAAVEFSRAANGLDGRETIAATDPLGVLADDLVHGLPVKARGRRKQKGGE